MRAKNYSPIYLDKHYFLTLYRENPLDKHCESKYDIIVDTIGSESADNREAELLRKLLNLVEQNISCEDIKAEVGEIYRNKNFSDEEKIRKIQAKIDEAKKKGF